MQLKEQIISDIKTAMKEKNSSALSILRVLKGEVERNEQTSKGKVELSDADIVAIVKKSIDSIKESGGNPEEEAVLSMFLPKQFSNDELMTKLTSYIIFEGLSKPYNMGQIMSYFKTNYAGQYDGKTLSSLIKTIQ